MSAQRGRPGSSARRGLPVARAACGIALLAAGQTATLVHLRPYSDAWYPLVWFGFILLSDAIVETRTGASLVSARPREVAWMLVSSAAIWWLFELANALHLASWTYTPSPDVPSWAQRARSTIAFASLLPATLEAGLLALALSPPDPGLTPIPSPRRAPTIALAVVGAGLLALAWRVASLALPLGLTGALLVLDATNALRARPSLVGAFVARRPRGPIVLFAANVAAGVVGEAWNYPADPKWTYDAPYAGTLKLFEMPLPGYLGYGALAWTLFAAYHAVRPRRLASKSDDPGLVALGLA